MAHQTKQPTPIGELAPEVPQTLVAVVERLMEKTPEARYAAAEEIMEALRPFAPTTPTGQIPHRRKVAGAHVPRDPIANWLPAARAPRAPVPAQQPPLPARYTQQKTAPAAHMPAPVPSEPEAPQKPLLPPEPEMGGPRVIPGNFGGESGVPWEERLGPIGIA